MRLNTHGEIIVYLDYHSKVSDGGGDLILDFRQEVDYVRFTSVFNELNENGDSVGTYLRIIGYSGNKRLVRGCYYRLNVELLKNARLDKITDSYLFIAEFNFNGVNAQKLIGRELLQSHEPLDYKQLYWTNYAKHNDIYIPQDCTGLQLYVADVGQANWNELRSNGHTVVQYDMGAELYAKSQSVDNIYNMHRQRIDASNKAVLVISHWDVDHVHCLTSMSDDDIRNTFSRVFCPNVLKTNTARQILQHLTKVLTSANVYCFTPVKHSSRSLYHMRPCFQLFNNVALYMGEQSRNINHCGIVMFVTGDTASVNYTGDCLLCQAEEVMHDAISKGSQATNHILIAPHHGGANKKRDMQYKIQHPIQRTEVCISVGYPNQYNHPNPKMLAYLNAISDEIKRTDKDGDITMDI